MGEQQDAFEATLAVLKLSPELESLLRDVAAERTTLTPTAASAAGIPEQAYEAALRASEEHAAATASLPERRAHDADVASAVTEESRASSEGSGDGDSHAEDGEDFGGQLQ